MLLTVIIPNFNHGLYLRQRIDSVLGQSFQEFEVIILDDCSIDNSRDIIESFRSHPKVRQIIYNEANSGSPFVQWEKGIKLAKGDWIWIAESDDWADPNFLEILTGYIQNSTAGIIYSNSLVTSDTGQAVGPFFTSQKFSQVFKQSGREFIKNHMINTNSVPNASAVIFKKALFGEISGSYKNFRVNGDWLFWVELMKNSNVVYDPKTLNYFRSHPHNVRSKTYYNGVFLTEIFYIQAFISKLLSLDKIQTRTLKYNMLNRMLSSVLYHQVNLSFKQFLTCLKYIGKVNNGVTLALLKTFVTLRLKKPL